MTASTSHRRAITSSLVAAALLLAPGTTAHAASDTWIGFTDSLWSATTNWASGNVPGTGDTATFNGAGGGNTTVDLGTGVTLGALVFDTADVAAYTIGSGAVGSQTLTLGTTGNAITMNSTVANDQLFNSNLALSVTATPGTTSTYYAVTNNSLTNSLTFAGGISASTTGVKVLNVTGSGNTAISGAITSGTGSVSLFKTGSGTLTLSGGATFDGAGVKDGSNFSSSAVFREGTTILNGGTYSNSGGELIVGGVATPGGAGTNTTLQLENGTTLNNIGWLSIGRGNGNGTATSNLTLNGNAAISATSMSAGFNAGNAGNIPKGTITLNGTSSLTLATNYQLGESAGSDFTMTLNDTSSVTVGSGTIYVGKQNGKGTLNVNTGTTFTTNGEIRVAFSDGNGSYNGSGTINVDGGTVSTRALTVGRNNNDVTSTLNGTVNVTAGELNVRDQTSLIGWRGIGTTGTVNISGGSYNQGTTATSNMVIGSFTGANGAVNVSGTGELTLQRNSNLLFSSVSGANASTRSLTISGGDVTFYSDAGSTVGGTGVIDLMNTANAAGVNTINLDGGTLTANQIKATSATGTRVINFNGGTLKSGASGLASAFLASDVASTANVRNGGAIIDTNGNSVTIGQALVHSTIVDDNATDGGLTKNGAGTLTLSGANTYTGLTTISAGTLALASAGTFDSSSGVKLGTSSSQGTLDLTTKSAFSFGSSQTVSGYGTINIGSGKTVTIDGTLAPGNSPGIVSVTGSLALGGSSATNMEIAGAGTAGTDYGLISVSESLTYGGALTIAFIDGFTPSAGQSFDLFNSFTSQSGTFTSVTVTGTGLTALGDSSGFSGTVGGLNYTFLYSSGDLTVAASAIPEPSTYAAIVGALALAGVVWQRRRRAGAAVQG